MYIAIFDNTVLPCEHKEIVLFPDSLYEVSEQLYESVQDFTAREAHDAKWYQRVPHSATITDEVRAAAKTLEKERQMLVSRVRHEGRLVTD